MTIANTILNQLGGNRFIAMTGSKNFAADGNTLRMSLAKNISGANMLYITLDPAQDTYIMRFFKYTPGKLNKKTFEWTNEKIIEIEQFDGVYFDMLQDLFTQVTGMRTSL